MDALYSVIGPSRMHHNVAKNYIFICYQSNMPIEITSNPDFSESESAWLQAMKKYSNKNDSMVWTRTHHINKGMTLMLPTDLQNKGLLCSNDLHDDAIQVELHEVPLIIQARYKLLHYFHEQYQYYEDYDLSKNWPLFEWAQDQIK